MRWLGQLDAAQSRLTLRSAGGFGAYYNNLLVNVVDSVIIRGQIIVRHAISLASALTLQGRRAG